MQLAIGSTALIAYIKSIKKPFIYDQEIVLLPLSHFLSATIERKNTILLELDRYVDRRERGDRYIDTERERRVSVIGLTRERESVRESEKERESKRESQMVRVSQREEKERRGRVTEIECELEREGGWESCKCLCIDSLDISINTYKTIIFLSN